MTTRETIDRAAEAMHADQCPDDGDADETCSCDTARYDRLARTLADAGLLADDAWEVFTDTDGQRSIRRKAERAEAERDEARDTIRRLNRRAQLAEAALHKQLAHPYGAQDPTVEALAERVRELEATIQRVRDLADAWDNIPQYVATVYDTGRSNQREMCLQELLTALDQEDHS